MTSENRFEQDTGRQAADFGAVYSVLMPVYRGERAAFFREALNSMLNQTVPPAEMVVVCDGPLTPELDEVLADYELSSMSMIQAETHPDLVRDTGGHGTAVKFSPSLRPVKFRVLRLPENVGIGAALAKGVEACSYDLIARMDSDDVAAKDRCARQLAAFAKDSALTLCSGTIAEFQTNPGETIQLRRLPLTQAEILRYAKRRNPMNHMAVMAKRSAILAAGNYRSIAGAEDYDLWVRMLCGGCKAANLPDILVYARIGNGMFARRGGLSYVKSALSLQREFRRLGFLTPADYLSNCAVRLAVGLMPSGLRERIYRNRLRERK